MSSVCPKMIRPALDSALDRSVIAGYTRLGYRIRSRGWRQADLPRLEGKTVLITGATSGLGLAAAEGFPGLGQRSGCSPAAPSGEHPRGRG